MKPVTYHLGAFPPKQLDWQRLVPLIGPANAALARYDGLLSAIPNPHVLLSPLVTQEAVLSSKIEGTRVTVGEVLEYEAHIHNLSESQKNDAEEVINYRKALQACSQAIEERPFSQHILRSAHAILMQGVRGQGKTPGAYRTNQNWIGSSDSTIETASYIPIAPEHLQTGMDLWEHYFNEKRELDALVQLAIIHAEFEALHPFNDGNGRLGRMLIPLFMYQRKLLHSPDFYMSAYLEANRDEYIDRLRAISSHGSWTEWCEFFLKGILSQAQENERKAKNILSLYNTLRPSVTEITHSQYAPNAVDFMFRIPIFSTPHFIQESNIPKPTAIRIVNLLVQHNIIEPLRSGKGRSASIYMFTDLLRITEGL